jgi:competence protein ComEA
MQIGTPEWRPFQPPPLDPEGPGDGTGRDARGPRPLTAGTLALAGVVGSAVLGLVLLLMVVSAPDGRGLIVGGELLPVTAGEVPLPAVGHPAGGLVDERSAIVVDVEGAVARPGLQQLRRGDRVGDAIRAAGGFGPMADLAAAAAALNLAEVLSDGQKVLVPGRGMASRIEVAAGTGSSPGSPARVDVNRASQAELESLPGIGPVTAGKIMEARTAAPFRAVEELRSRGLVGESVFGRIRDLVTTGP